MVALSLRGGEQQRNRITHRSSTVNVCDMELKKKVLRIATDHIKMQKKQIR